MFAVRPSHGRDFRNGVLMAILQAPVVMQLAVGLVGTVSAHYD